VIACHRVAIFGHAQTVECFKVTKQGAPEHPLYQRANAEVIPFPFIVTAWV